MVALDISADKLVVFCLFVTIDRILFMVFTDDVTAEFRIRFCFLRLSSRVLCIAQLLSVIIQLHFLLFVFTNLYIHVHAYDVTQTLTLLCQGRVF
jgi:hypothetical protein